MSKARSGVTMSLDDAGSTFMDPGQDTERQVEGNFFTGAYYVDDAYGIQKEAI